MVTVLNVIEIGSVEKSEYCIIWLHGYGGNGNNFTPAVSLLELPVSDSIHFVFPHGPIQLSDSKGNAPRRAWFNLPSIDQNQYDKNEIKESIDQVHQLIRQEIQEGISSKNIFLAGFSQGGYIALQSGLNFPEPIGGLIGLSTFFRPTPQLVKANNPKHTMPPIFLAHGSRDTVVPFKSGLDSSKILKEMGCSVTFESYPMDHNLCLEELTALGKWLAQLMHPIK